MVLLEDLINNIKRKVYGRPVDMRPTYLYYCEIEEYEFSSIGDCVIIHSGHTVVQGDHVYNELESKSMIPIWLEPHSVLSTDRAIQYTAFFLPNQLKVNLSRQRVENHAGLVFNE
jgi:hypothetical protein